MVRDGRLLDRHGRFQITHADLAGTARQDGQDLQPHGMAQDLQVVADLLRVIRTQLLIAGISTAAGASFSLGEFHRHGHYSLRIVISLTYLSKLVNIMSALP